MIIEWIERKKRKRNCRVYFESDSFQIKDCFVAPVHLIPEEIHDDQEFDFYVETQYDIYMLRITNSGDKCGTVHPAKVNGIIYIVCHLPIRKNTIITSIQKILKKLEEYGFPNLKNPKCKITFPIE